MICIHSGYCCMMLDVVIIRDINLPISMDNWEHKPSGVPCKYLVFERDAYWCDIHRNPKYKDTPCYEHSQFELVEESVCRMGEHIALSPNLKKMLKDKYAKKE